MQAVDSQGHFRFGLSEFPLDPLNFAEADLSDVSAWWGRPQKTWLGRAVRRMRLKRWHYFSVCHRDVFLCTAVADVGYIGNTFCYLVDRRTGQKFEKESLVPLALGIQVGAASQRSSRTGGIQFSHRESHWFCELDLNLEGRPLRAQWKMATATPLCLLYPLHQNRAAYTHKEIGGSCSGQFEWDGRALDLDEAVGGMDYTCSYADRHTVWKWLFLTGTLADGRRFGINLSDCLYESAENYLWLDGRIRHLGSVHFLPTEESHWRIHGESLEIAFHPLGRRRQNVNFGLVRSSFQQPYGEALGWVLSGSERLDIASAFGVAEDHEALW